MKAERRIISERCMIKYIQGGKFRVSFKFCMGDKLWEKMEGGKNDEIVVHFDVHTPIQIVFLSNF